MKHHFSLLLLSRNHLISRLYSSTPLAVKTNSARGSEPWNFRACGSYRNSYLCVNTIVGNVNSKNNNNNNNDNNNDNNIINDGVNSNITSSNLTTIGGNKSKSNKNNIKILVSSFLTLGFLSSYTYFFKQPGILSSLFKKMKNSFHRPTVMNDDNTISQLAMPYLLNQHQQQLHQQQHLPQPPNSEVQFPFTEKFLAMRTVLSDLTTSLYVLTCASASTFILSLSSMPPLWSLLCTNQSISALSLSLTSSLPPSSTSISSSSSSLPSTKTVNTPFISSPFLMASSSFTLLSSMSFANFVSLASSFSFLQSTNYHYSSSLSSPPPPSLSPSLSSSSFLLSSSPSFLSSSLSSSSSLSNSSNQEIENNDSKNQNEEEEKKRKRALQLADIYCVIRFDFLNFFTPKHNLNYEIYSSDVELKENISRWSFHTFGKLRYRGIIETARKFCGFCFEKVQIDIMDITKYPESDEIRVRWRVVATTSHVVESKLYIDAYSIFLVDSQGKVSSHRIERVMEDFQMSRKYTGFQVVPTSDIPQSCVSSANSRCKIK